MLLARNITIDNQYLAKIETTIKSLEESKNIENQSEEEKAKIVKQIDSNLLRKKFYEERLVKLKDIRDQVSIDKGLESLQKLTEVNLSDDHPVIISNPNVQAQGDVNIFAINQFSNGEKLLHNYNIGVASDKNVTINVNDNSFSIRLGNFIKSLKNQDNKFPNLDLANNPELKNISNIFQKADNWNLDQLSNVQILEIVNALKSLDQETLGIAKYQIIGDNNLNDFIFSFKQSVSKRGEDYQLQIRQLNNLDNYGHIIGQGDIILKSVNGDINNYSGAELLVGKHGEKTGSLTMQAVKGNISQNSKNSVVVNGDHTITADNYTNTGRIDIAGSLVMNIATNLINEVGAMIYSGTNMFLNVVNNLTNKKSATIYAENDLYIKNRALTTAEQNTLNTLKSEIAATSDNIIIKQKRLEIANIFDNLRINKLENLSGNIETYNGDIYIGAKTLENKRSELPTQGAEIYYNHVDGYTFNYRHWNHYWETKLYRSEKQGSGTKSAIINATNNLTINSDTLTNSSSSIYAKNDMTIKSNSIDNISNIYRDYVKMTHRRTEINWQWRDREFYYTGTSYTPDLYAGFNGSPNYHYQAGYNHDNTRYKNTTYQELANIKAGGNFIGTIAGDINNISHEHRANNAVIIGNAIANTIMQKTNVQSVIQESSQVVNGIDISTLLSSGKLSQDLSEYLNGQIIRECLLRILILMPPYLKLGVNL